MDDFTRGFRPRKYLGQSFLIDRNIQRKIIQACQITPRDTILEIGAGRGELTRLIAQRADRIYAVELDRELCSVLDDNLNIQDKETSPCHRNQIPAKNAKVTIINDDILRFDIGRYFKYVDKIKIIGNLPYSITTPIIVRLLKFRNKIEYIFITVQKEFAQRMVARVGTSDWSAFSCFLQYYTQPQILFFIKKTCFRPQPKVDSALVKLTVKKKFSLEGNKEHLLFKVIRLSFQQRRKTLRNALRGVISSERLNRYFNQYNIDKNIRGERLSLQDFINLIHFK